MTVSFLVRLAEAALSTGRLSGEVEHVATGERAPFRDAAELTAWCAARVRGAQAPVISVLPVQVDGDPLDDAVGTPPAG